MKITPAEIVPWLFIAIGILGMLMLFASSFANGNFMYFHEQWKNAMEAKDIDKMIMWHNACEAEYFRIHGKFPK